MLEEEAQAVARTCHHRAQRSLGGVLRAWNFGSGQTSVEVGLAGRMSRAERALRFRFSSAPRAPHR